MSQWLKRCVECATMRYYHRRRTKCAVCGGELVVVSEDTSI